MSYLYLSLNIGSFIIPFLFSFHPKLKFYKKWKYLFPAILIMMAIFIPWDVIFTNEGFWGFNETYHSGYLLFGLPLEEWLFFICIPYACMFIHYSMLYFFPNLSLSSELTAVLYVILVTTLLAVILYYYDRWYTVINFSYAILILGLVYNYNRKLLNSFFITFLVILIPFFVINGILTGSGLESPVVWYDNTENLGIRILTIPVEDIIYALGMLLTVLACTEYFEDKKKA